MKRALPTALTLVLATGLWLVDPVRRAEPAIDPASIALTVATPAAWGLSDAQADLPRAYPPHNRVAERTWVFDSMPGTSGRSFLRVVVAQDRRDLLAYDPVHAMQAGGWHSRSAQSSNGLWLTHHARSAPLLDETVTVVSAFVIPDVWSDQSALVYQQSASGPGWPGPGATVQLILPEDQPSAEVCDHIKQIAQHIAEQLASTTR